MEAAPQKPAFAWQPLTRRGVAAFAFATFGRLWLVQLVFALLAAASVMFVLYEAWFPAIRRAILELPPQGQVRSGQLSWPGFAPVKLAENRFLSIAIDLEHAGTIRSPAHVQAELGSNDLELISLLGSVRLGYPQQWIIVLNRREAEPWFGAWSPAILAMAAALVIVALFLSWSVLSTIYFLPAWLLAFFANRHLTPGGAWRLCGAALMPGCLLLASVLFFYALSLFDVVHLLVFAALHLLLGWVYVVLAVLVLPRHPAVADPKTNPFVRPPL